VFRRRSDDASSAATALAEQDDTTQPRDPQAPKGRPTPKRSEAEASRRTKVTVPKDRKEASKQSRERMRAEREKQRTALIAGDERYLPARDKGPVRRFARDYVDSRWSLAEFFLPYAVLVLILSIVRWWRTSSGWASGCARRSPPGSRARTPVASSPTR
jgi:hypothetical protein